MDRVALCIKSGIRDCYCTLGSVECLQTIEEKLSEMVRFETVSKRGVDRNAWFEGYFALLKKLFPVAFGATVRIPIEGALLLKWRGEHSRAPFVLMSHSDVADAEEEGWTYPPFSGAIVNGSVWGRGAAESKSSMCAMLEALSVLAEEGFEPKHDVYIASSVDKEIISGVGSRNIASYFKKNGIWPDLVLDDGGRIGSSLLPNMKNTYGLIGVAEKGFADFQLTARGGAEITSAPGKNTPVERLAKTVLALNDKIFPYRLTPIVSELIKCVAPEMTGLRKLMFSRPEHFRKALLRNLSNRNEHFDAMLKTTLAFTMCRASEAPNILPRKASVTVSVRILPGDSVSGVRDKISSAAKKFNVEVTLLAGNEPVAAKSSDDGYKKVAGALREIYPDCIPAPCLLTDATDSRHLDRIADCVLRFSPFFLTREQEIAVHSINENISINALKKGVQYYQRLLRMNNIVIGNSFLP